MLLIKAGVRRTNHKKDNESGGIMKKAPNALLTSLIICSLVLSGVTPVWAEAVSGSAADSVLSAVTASEDTQGAERAAAVQLQRDGWAPDVKKAVNEFVAQYGNTSSAYSETPYVVSDFDNTCSIFDVEEQLAVYQLQQMVFGFTPEQLPDILATGLSDLETPREGYALDEKSHSYSDWISDITAAYTRLYQSYGPFTAEGPSGKAGLDEIQSDPQWMEFAAKMRAMYDLVYDNESASVAYPWVLYWFTGLSEDEVYRLAYDSHSTYKEVETSTVDWVSPEDIDSAVGQVEYEWTSGTQVTENIREMFTAYAESGINVWICSASCTDAIRAAVDVWGLHDCVTGVIAMTNKVKDGKYVNEYDYETGYAWYTQGKDGWKRGDTATGAQTQGPGKVTDIDNVLVSSYGHGPIAGFMDSTGDYDFCTVYDSLKLVICFNRASRKVTDGGGVIGELAIYQRDTLGYDLKKASDAGDTLYVLQGRDENGLRTLRGINRTLTYGATEEKLFKNEENEAQLQYMIDHTMTTEEVINTFAPKTAEDDADNVLGFAYGFSADYEGYHSHQDQ